MMYKVTLMTLDVENTFEKNISKVGKSSFLYSHSVEIKPELCNGSTKIYFSISLNLVNLLKHFTEHK